MRKKIVFAALMILLSGTIAFVAGEILVRLVSPRASMYPRREFSAHYGFEHFKGIPIVHEAPGKWRFTYSINQYGYRGRAVPVSNEYSATNIVVLGDSYSFGVGVQDGEEYPAVLDESLGDGFDVVNLGVGGWGLTQEVRRYYEFGQVYQPKLVILQFTANDPQDDLINRVTTVEDGRFRFHDSVGGLNWIKRLMSRSIIQKSQIYNLLRDSVYRWMEPGLVENAIRELEDDPGIRPSNDVPIEEKLYIDLLDLLARDLDRRRVHLVFIAVNSQLNDFPFIHRKVLELESEGRLVYARVAQWLGDESEYGSPEGHAWGAKAHRIIGTRLSELVKRTLDAPGKTIPGHEREGGPTVSSPRPSISSPVRSVDENPHVPARTEARTTR